MKENYVQNLKRHGNVEVLTDPNGWKCEVHNTSISVPLEQKLIDAALDWFKYETVKSIDGLEWMLQERVNAKRRGGKIPYVKKKIIGKSVTGDKYYAISIGFEYGRSKYKLLISEPIV